VLPAGLVAEAPGQTHRPNVAGECPGHAVDPAQQHRRGVVQPGAIVKEPVGRGEAQVLALVIGGNGGITLTEQLGEGEQIELVAMQARLDEHRPRIPAWNLGPHGRRRAGKNADPHSGELAIVYKDAGTNRAQMLAYSRT
jgi:hypothetical protein